MTTKQFSAVEMVMLQSMQQTVHDTNHVYRVLWAALRIAKTLPEANTDVVILAALLHDIGRLQEDDFPGKGHAELGAEMAGPILEKLGWDKKTRNHVQDCIKTHSYTKGLKPISLEGQIVFDADKLDLTGAIGTARALLFGAQIQEPFYLVGENGMPTPGLPEEGPSILREYNRKLKYLATKFYTQEARAIATERQKTMDAWFLAFSHEINEGYKMGSSLLKAALSPSK